MIAHCHQKSSGKRLGSLPLPADRFESIMLTGGRHQVARPVLPKEHPLWVFNTGCNEYNG
jgi:hypothetical protein